MSEVLRPDPDPVVEAYKKDIDRTLIRENLKLTVEERFRKSMALARFADELRRRPPSDKITEPRPLGSGCTQRRSLRAVRSEVRRVEPALERDLARRPFRVEHCVPGSIAVATLDDHVLPEYALERKAQP